MEEMNLSDDDEEEAAPAKGKTEALRQFEEELTGLKASQKLLNELLSKSQEDTVAKAAGNQRGSTTVSAYDISYFSRRTATKDHVTNLRMLRLCKVRHHSS